MTRLAGNPPWAAGADWLLFALVVSMRNLHSGNLRRHGFGVFATAAVVALTHVAGAAPKAGPPFTLAEPNATDVRHSIAGNARGYLLSWSAGGAVRAQALNANAARSGPLEQVAEPATSGPAKTEYAGTRVVANATDYLLQYGFSRTDVPSGKTAPEVVEVGFKLKVFSENGGIAPPLSSSPPPRYSGVTSGAGDGFSLLALTPRPGTGDPLSLAFSMSKGSVVGTEVQLFGSLLTTKLVDMASNGVKTLATVRNEMGAALVRFGEGTLTEAPGASAAKNMLVASHEDLFVLVSEADNGSLYFVLTAGDIPGRSSPTVVLNPEGSGPESLLAIEPADESCLVLSAATGDGGSVLRVRRLTYDGRVLDPAGVDVAEGSEGDLARSGGEQWLLATHETVNGKELIRGRFIGEGELPPPPVDVPVPTDAGVPPAPDANAPTSDSGGRPSSSGGTGGRASSSGGTNASSSGGVTGADASEGNGGSPAGASARGSDDSGCAVKPSRRADDSALGWLLAAGALFARRRSVRASVRELAK